MMKLAIFLAVVCFWNQGSARRLTRSTFDNEVDNGLDDIETTERVVKSWVKINQPQEREIRVNFGDSLELECEASGSPAPVLQWYKDRVQITDNEIVSNDISPYQIQGLAKARARLRINSADKTEIYFCKAQSGTKTAKTATKVIVTNSLSNFIADEIRELKAKPSKQFSAARITFFDSIYMDNIGNSVEFPCKASGYPTPATLWLDPSENVIGDGDSRFTLLPSGGLRINKIRWNDMGPYTCVAKNDRGQDSVTTFLYPMLVCQI